METVPRFTIEELQARRKEMEKTMNATNSETEGFDWYEHLSRRGLSRVPLLTVTTQGRISLTRTALEALGKPQRLRIGYSAAQRMIAIAGAGENERGSVRGTANTPSGGLSGVDIAPFFKKHDIVIPKTTRFYGESSAVDDERVLLFSIDDGEEAETSEEKND